MSTNGARADAVTAVSACFLSHGSQACPHVNSVFQNCFATPGEENFVFLAPERVFEFNNHARLTYIAAVDRPPKSVKKSSIDRSPAGA